MGNGINFDINDDASFRTFCVQKLTENGERLEALKDMHGVVRDNQVTVMSDLKTLQLEHEVVKSDIITIKDEMKDAKKWENIKMVVGPVMVVLHSIARGLGIHV